MDGGHSWHDNLADITIVVVISAIDVEWWHVNMLVWCGSRVVHNNQMW